MINARNICFCIISSFLFLTASNAHADTATYTLDNVILEDGQQITGTFVWTFSAGDFEGGSGEFTALDIPFQSNPLANTEMVLTIENKQIEISLDVNLHDTGLGIILKFVQPLSPTQSSLIDLSTSFFECCGNGFKDQPFISGNIAPSTSPGLELTGLATKSAVCTNKTTGEKKRIRLFGATVWSCGDAGIAPQGGEKIQLVTVGFADGLSPVGATLTDIMPLKAKCKNLTTGMVVIVNLANGSTVDCEAAGLSVTEGHKIFLKILGLANDF